LKEGDDRWPNDFALNKPNRHRDIYRTTIRDAKSSDFPAISECYWQDPEVPWDVYSNPKLLKQIVGIKGFLVAEAKGAVVGFVHYRKFRKSPWFDPSRRAYGQILELHVREAFRGHRIGSQLIMKAIGRLEAEGCRVIYTNTDETNKRSMKLYRDMGFKPFLKTYFLKRLTRRVSGTRRRGRAKIWRG